MTSVVQTARAAKPAITRSIVFLPSASAAAHAL
jgi:hypothetical protein